MTEPSENSPTTSTPTSERVKKSLEGLNTIKVIVIGDANVGKTSIIKRLCMQMFSEDSKTTVQVDMCQKTICIDEQNVQLRIWDTAGQERYAESLLPWFFRNADAAILVYDVTERSSFESLPRWIKHCSKHISNMKNFPMSLVGNKIDNIQIQKEVTTEEGLEFAENNSMQFYETSAKDENCSRGVEKAFFNVAKKVVDKRNEPAETESSSEVQDVSETTGENIYVENISIHQHHHEHIVNLASDEKKEESKCCPL